MQPCCRADPLVADKTVKAIALEPGLSHEAVQIHRAHILEKTGTDSVVYRIWLAIETGTLDNNPPA